MGLWNTSGQKINEIQARAKKNNNRADDVSGLRGMAGMLNRAANKAAGFNEYGYKIGSQEAKAREQRDQEQIRQRNTSRRLEEDKERRRVNRSELRKRGLMDVYGAGSDKTGVSY